MNNNHNAPIPVGFRFHPTDEELVGYYLHGKVGRAQRDQLIHELDLYKIEPWDLHEVCRIGDLDAAENQSDWYFFSHKDKKYPTGNRANRATTAGFWKATGRDKPIHTLQRHVIGMRKTLVFYRGRAPHGQKTDWIMHEFRLDEGPGVAPTYESDGWVVCRVFRKTKNLKTTSHDTSCSFEEDQHIGNHLGSHLGSHLGNQLLPELMSPAAAYGNSHLQHPGGFATSFTCKQEISVDDYDGTPGGTPIQDPASFLQVDHQLHMRLSRIPHSEAAARGHHQLNPAVSLAPCSSSTFRALHGEYSVVPMIHAGTATTSIKDFDVDARSSVDTQEAAFPLLQHQESSSAYWMEGAQSGTRGDQTLADVTGHVERPATDHLTSTSNHESSHHLVHLWNV